MKYVSLYDLFAEFEYKKFIKKQLYFIINPIAHLKYAIGYKSNSSISDNLVYSNKDFIKVDFSNWENVSSADEYKMYHSITTRHQITIYKKSNKVLFERFEKGIKEENIGFNLNYYDIVLPLMKEPKKGIIDKFDIVDSKYRIVKKSYTNAYIKVIK